MRPILLDLPLPGGLHLPMQAYGTFLVLGMLAAAWASGRHGPRLGLRRADAFDLGVWLLAGGMFGAHLLHVAFEWRSFFGDGLAAGLAGAVDPRRGGLVYYGGLAAAIPVIWLWGRRRGLPFVEMLDFVAPLGALGLGVTRIGCFLNGCCFGIPSRLPWAVTFPPGSLAHQRQVAVGLVAPEQASLPVHPVQLYEAVFALVLFAWLWRRFPRRAYAGEVVVGFGLLYGLWRIGAEALRADAPGWRPGELGITPSQWLSIALVLAAAAGWWAACRVARAPATRAALPVLPAPSDSTARSS